MRIPILSRHLKMKTTKPALAMANPTTTPARASMATETATATRTTMTTSTMNMNTKTEMERQPPSAPFRSSFVVVVGDRERDCVGRGLRLAGREVVKHVPAWFPGQKFKIYAKEVRALSQDLSVYLSKIIKDTWPPCFVGEALGDLAEMSDPELFQDVTEVAASIYGGY
ncbi:hypothetical protein BU17DRAFT_70507 [Hysterangium stoloniferum]|nr:hypothetical protein BU17DRAFT_70507 [Hysterangium stoloniferum]